MSAIVRVMSCPGAPGVRAILEMPKSRTLMDGLAVGALDAETGSRASRSRWTMPSGVGVRDGLARLEDEVEPLARSETRAALLQARPRDLSPRGTPDHHVGRARLRAAHVDHPRDVLALILTAARASRAKRPPTSGGHRLREEELDARPSGRAGGGCAATTTPMPPSPSTAGCGTCPASTSPGLKSTRCPRRPLEASRRGTAREHVRVAAGHAPP